MIVEGVPVATLRGIAIDLDLWAQIRKAEDGGVELLLYSRGRWTDSKTSFACVHGHRAFIAELLVRCPDATVETAEATYLGLADFEQQGDEWERIRAKWEKHPCSCTTLDSVRPTRYPAT